MRWPETYVIHRRLGCVEKSVKTITSQLLFYSPVFPFIRHLMLVFRFKALWQKFSSSFCQRRNMEDVNNEIEWSICYSSCNLIEKLNIFPLRRLERLNITINEAYVHYRTQRISEKEYMLYFFMKKFTRYFHLFMDWTWEIFPLAKFIKCSIYTILI